MEKVEKRFKKMMNVSMAMWIIDFLVGLLFILYTEFATKSNLVILGALISIHGLFYIIRYVYDGLGNSIFKLDIIFGVVAFVLGVFAIFNPFKPLNVIGLFFGAWLICSGIEKAFYAYKLGRAYDEIFPLVLILAILTIVMGCLSIFNPFKLFMLITRLIGMFLICDCLFEIMTFMLFKRRAKELLNIFE